MWTDIYDLGQNKLENTPPGDAPKGINIQKPGYLGSLEEKEGGRLRPHSILMATRKDGEEGSSFTGKQKGTDASSEGELEWGVKREKGRHDYRRGGYLRHLRREKGAQPLEY